MLIPYLVRRTGFATFLIITAVFTLLSYFSCVLVYESTKLLPGNFKMRQKTDFESLLSAHMNQKSLAVVLSKHLYML